MATELEAIIQRMRAEGRSEEDIAKVVAEHKARKANPPVKAVAEIEPSSEIVNVDGVDVSLGQEEDKKESEEWKTQLANSLNTKKVISENPILNEDGSPNTEVTQQNIDNIPSPIAFTPKQPEGIVIDTEIDYKASLGLPNDLTKINQAKGIRSTGLPEAEKALEILNNKFSDFGFEFDISEKNFNAEIAITAPNGESLIISPIADNDQEIQNFIKENSGEHITKDEIAINEQLLKDYNEGKIDLTAAQLSKIVKITPEAEEYVMGFMPKFEDIKEGINPKTKQSYLYEEYFKAINKAYVGDPRTQEIGENTEKEILDSEEWINKQKELQNLHINLGVDKEQYDLLSKEAKELKIQIEDPKFIENINKEWQKRVDWMQGQCQKWGIYCDEKWYKSNPEFSNHPLIREFNNKVDQINGIIDNKTSDEDLQVMVEAYQDAITKEYNEEFQKRLKENPEAAKIYKEYGIIAERLLPDYAKGFDRSKDDYLNALDQTMALNENLEDPSFGELVKMVFTPGVKPYIPSFERGLVTLKESHRHLVEGTKLAWNELQITLQKETLESRNRVVENLKQQIGGGPFTGGGSGIELDMKISEARQLDPSGQLNRYLVAYRGTRDDNLTVGEFFDQRKSALDETVESMETDYMEMADAYKELGKLNKLDGDEAFLSLEGFMQHLALGYQQASHMSFSLAGTGFFTAGTVLSGSGVGASAGVPLMYTGGALMAVGASIQGAMTYSSVYMEAVRRQMQKDPKYANREISGEEFIEALKNPKYGNQMSALGAGGSVIVTELLSDIGMAYAGGKVGGLVFKNPFINKLTRNSFTNYLTNITTAGITYEANIWKEFGTEGFQNYLEQGFTNLSVGEESPFTKNIDTAQMLEDAEAGKKVGRLFGISSVSGAIGGRSQIADIMLGSYTSRAKAIATKLKMQPGSSTSITVENLFKDLKNEIENDLNLTNKEKRNEIKNISNIRNAGLAVPIIITKKNKGKLINLLVEQKELENKIKEKNNKQLSVVDIERKQVVDGEIESIIRESVVQEESLKGPTSPMGMFGVGKEKITAEEQADLNKINIDLYKDSTDETTRNNAIKDIIEDNAGFFLSDKGGINFDANFKGYINKNTGKPISPQEVLNEVSALLPGIIGAFAQDKGANFTTYAGVSLNKKLPGILESLIGAKEASKTKEATAQELENIAAPETEKAKGKEFKKRKYPTDIAAIEKQTAGVRPKILNNIKESVKSFMASAVGKTKEIGKKGKKIITKLDPASVEKDLKAKNKATEAAVAAAIGKQNSKQFIDFVTNIINDGYIETIPIAAMKKRFQNVKGFKIEKTGRETLGAGTGIYKLSDLNKQALIDFYTKDQGGRRSFIGLLAKGLTIEQFQEVKTDKAFMNDLAFKLKEDGSKLTAEEFMNEVERMYDKRTIEKRSLDDTSNIDRFIKNVLDPTIKEYGGTMGSSPHPSLVIAQAMKTALKGYQSLIKAGKTFKEALSRFIKDFINSFKGKNKLTKEEAAWVDKELKRDLKTPDDVTEIKLNNLIDKFAQKFNVDRGIAYEKVIYKHGRQAQKIVPGWKIVGKQTEQGEGRDIDIEAKIWGFDFNVEAKLEKAIYGSANGIFNFIKNTFKYSDKSIEMRKNYPALAKKLDALLKKSQPALKEFKRVAEALDFDIEKSGDIMDRDTYDNLIRETATTFGSVDIDGNTIADIYNSKGIYYIQIKGEGLYYLGENKLGLPVPKFEGSAELRMRVKAGAVKVEGAPNDRRVTIVMDPTNFKRTGQKSNHRIDTAAGISKLMSTEEVALLKQKQEADAKISKLNSQVISKDPSSTTQTKETLENSQDTQVNAQKVNKKKKGISVFDFDDTLAKTKEKVIVYAPAFKPGTSQEVSMKLTPAEFAEQAQDLESKGASFDFSQFEDVKGAKKGPLADLALKRQGKFGSGDIFILTARPQTSAQGIKTFLNGIGLNIPIENIIGLEDGTSQAKARWVLSKTKEGYNDFYFADDVIQNVKAVKQILDQVDVKSKVQQAIADKATTLDEEFNKQIEEVTGKEAYKEYSPARAKLEGKAKDKGFFKWLGRQLTMTPSVEDFMGLMYDIIGKGKQGNRHAQFILDKLMKPFNKAEQAILSAKVTVANDFAALKKAFPSLRTSKLGVNPLMQQIGVGPYTKSHAIRVYMWAKQGMEIPGLSKRDQNALVKAVEIDMELMSFADNVILIQKEGKYPPPGNNWTGGDMQSDILGGLDKGFRNKLMTEFNENAAIIFSEKNMNKLEAIYGTKWVEALQDSLRRMKSGSNRPVYQGGGSRIVNEMLDWLNGSVGAIMFINMRSGLLQLISNVNFINWGDNNIYAAAKAFASEEYWPTVIKLMNSDYLVNRRDGLKINVNEAELADAAKKSGMKGAIAYMLDKGFIITRIMDSLAIATGGATFYINRRNALLKRQNPETGKKYTKAEAEAKAFDDFYVISEDSQQSSNPSKISQQQASLAGRVILSFQNVTMQYNRKVKKAIRNLYNRRKNPGQTQRESDLGNLSQVIYYTTIQNVIFHSLQQTLFALLFNDETDDEEKDRAAKIANGMVDSLLFGLGFGGAAISTVKNVLMKIQYERMQKSPDYEEAVWEVFNFSPVLDSKIRKLRTTARTFNWNMEEIKKRGWSLDNPTYLAIAQLISATTNIPIDRVLRKTMNLRVAMDEETRTWQRVALILGWDTWSVGLPYWGLQSTIEKEEKEKAKIKADYKADIRKMKASGYKKVMARVLKDYDPKDIIELRSPAGTVVYYAKAGKGKQAKN